MLKIYQSCQKLTSIKVAGWLLFPILQIPYIIGIVDSNVLSINLFYNLVLNDILSDCHQEHISTCRLVKDLVQIAYGNGAF